MGANTLLLRLEGPLQSWGDQESKFVVRRTGDAPTKSGIMGLLCAALGISRADARRQLGELNALRMGVRIDRPGVRWWDYHTVGAGMEMRIAKGEGEHKPGAMLTRREYLCDASFLVALRGEDGLIGRLREAVLHPVWPVYLGRKACPPSVPLMGRRDESDTGEFPDLEAALRSVPWRKRLGEDSMPDAVESLLEWRAGRPGDVAPEDAEVWYDVAQSFDVPGHGARFVVRKRLSVGQKQDISIASPRQNRTPSPARPQANYSNAEWTSEAIIDVVDHRTGQVTQEPRGMRPRRLRRDHDLCVFCKSPATTVQHITYRHAGEERIEELRALCRLCHDAVTMIEYGMGMGLDRINPEDPDFRDRIIQKRREIIAFRSLETRRRRLEPEDVE